MATDSLFIVLAKKTRTSMLYVKLEKKFRPPSLSSGSDPGTASTYWSVN